eukprot:CAMPEP_0181195326 /NCGR_PEP_ID=MMETSP1096-20121128/14824_1 /TAXON_ID=156174 ORGANISM="Chrysochromulina ericina, Strain CCMP281" /NCGR_SAMPLE_ID=MMETSP1096 /ASSEMBLY_ACC=CAM_ASM_000453 /LENGTH=120 /DNA_ID=CAMNT_0023284915 /DNA_START=325 /DNA_END=686 /DNA_ORIENTATION=+
MSYDTLLGLGGPFDDTRSDLRHAPSLMASSSAASRERRAAVADRGLPSFNGLMPLLDVLSAASASFAGECGEAGSATTEGGGLQLTIPWSGDVQLTQDLRWLAVATHEALFKPELRLAGV